MKKSKFTIKVLAEVSIFAAIGFALDWLQSGIAKAALPILANGGSIGIAMLTVIIIAYRRGLVPGILCGFILSVVQMLQGPYVISGKNFDSAFMQTMAPFIQVLFDYLLAYTVCGFAGAFAASYHKCPTTKGKLIFIGVGSSLAGILKYMCHVISGILFWRGDIWGISGTGYSFIYNGIYCIPNIIIVTVISILLAKLYPQFFNPVDERMVEQQ